MERPEGLLTLLIVVVIAGFLGVAIGVAVLIRDTVLLIQKRHENGLRFSLLTLLIGTTIVATVLGLAAYVLGRSFPSAYQQDDRHRQN